MADSKSLRLRFSDKKHLNNMNLKEIYQKNLYKISEKLDVKKLVPVILKGKKQH